MDFLTLLLIIYIFYRLIKKQDIEIKVRKSPAKILQEELDYLDSFLEDEECKCKEKKK